MAVIGMQNTTKEVWVLWLSASKLLSNEWEDINGGGDLNTAPILNPIIVLEDSGDLLSKRRIGGSVF